MITPFLFTEGRLSDRRVGAVRAVDRVEMRENEVARTCGNSPGPCTRLGSIVRRRACTLFLVQQLLRPREGRLVDDRWYRDLDPLLARPFAGRTVATRNGAAHLRRAGVERVGDAATLRNRFHCDAYVIRVLPASAARGRRGDAGAGWRRLRPGSG